jgi:hypothetical protein
LTYRYPWVLESLECGDSLVWVHSQHLIDQVFGLRCDCVPLGLWILSEEKKRKEDHKHSGEKFEQPTYVIRPSLDLCV